MRRSELLPGVTLTIERPPAEPDPLRTDVAAFLGRTARGPAGVPVRVESPDEAALTFGPLGGDSHTPWALRGFFANGGRTAWVIRVGGGTAASAEWIVGPRAHDGGWGPGAPVRGGFRHAAYRVVATSPGAWAENTRVTIRFRASSLAGPPVVSVRVAAPGEPVETFPQLPPAGVVEALTASRLIRLEPAGDPVPVPGVPSGPLSMGWDLVLRGGADTPARVSDYAAAVQAQADLPEPALVALPDLDDLAPGDREEIVRALLTTAGTPHDRLIVLDAPGPLTAAEDVLNWAVPADAAAYHPWLLVPDTATTLRAVPPSGHVLGLIARLDAERGAHHTPANAVLLDAVDLRDHLPEAQQARLFAEASLNLLRCAPARGLTVWGGRTLAGRYVAHRRLIHLLVRAMRRVADPLVFDANGPEVRLALVRGLTSVLLAAFRAGALAGTRAEAAFRVVCDESNNPEGQDPGLVNCHVDVAPANPMEFIRLRLVLGQDRGLEVLEA
ncbi:hypothetical protein J2S43_001708 [Catenuloplanes nepalensis]|uniref:Phage tail protein n=1 Tax=Catenuloplanes nepalensis TaxID=587533 RepID=A0ABT9MP46_9ACTN|nr:phage tail sheath subtilisin-like domain-containing protein [Catenuloplanes nepalensis]MDP9793196.1 hypothetical protein [Catenuloplanes nepalensis]